MNELRRKQSSERIHARAVAAREALRQSKSSQINDELDELYERVVVSPSSGGGKENTAHRGRHRPRRVSLSKRLHLYICPLPLKKKKKTKKKKKKKKKKPSSFPTRKNQNQ